MKRLKVVVALVTILGLISVPASAQASQCASIEGRAILDFGVGVGTARLQVDGAQHVVPFYATGFVTTGPNTADLRFVWEFDQGTLVVIEHSTMTPVTATLLAFDSVVDIRTGGTGGMHWNGLANLAASTARFSVTGEICFDR
ncbi:MAG: hypothetical protein OEM32_06460 [Acidimicrobiia bacterium]|nr:hypothetical protein [Acidimicrobiia bacterium]